ncbi:MAG TPA: hypothetical protein VF111_13200 [Thermoanaerobaculia bacterium]
MDANTPGLPLNTRLAERCSTLLILTDELLTEFTTEEANALLWVEERVRRIYGDVDRLVQRFAQ